MDRTDNTHQDAPTVEELYPDLSAEDCVIAEQNLTRYVALIARMSERIASDPDALARFRQLTAPDGTLRSGTLNTSPVDNSPKI